MLKQLYAKAFKFWRKYRFYSPDYWESRYKTGENSGCGSYNKLAEFKTDVINGFIDNNDIYSVIEFGSGDGQQIKKMNYEKYLGFDVSDTAIHICRKMYFDDPTKSFFHIDLFTDQIADLTISLDVIYHLVEDSVYNKYMSSLFNASKKYVIIYSSNADDHENNGISPHVRHRKFTNWVENNRPEFVLTNMIKNKYPYNGKNEESSYADFFFYEKN